ncbi:MAG: nucleotidyltransferase family protein [Candidatus Omnitrophica bacterium]|nr:nucleotidyltransferase family protein [Candidatus Omnitrophota bacterium]
MKAVILAGGFGTRLKQTVKDLPKPMVDVDGKPFLEYLVLQLKKWDIKEVVLCVGYLKEVIKGYFNDGSKWGLNISYSEENSPLGTGGALRQAMCLCNEDDFLAMNGDSFLDVDFDKIISFHRKKSALATLSLIKVEDVNRYGRISINVENEVIEFCEKGNSGQGFINAGVYVFSKEIIEHIPLGKVSLEHEVLAKLINKKFYGVGIEGFFSDIGTPDSYKRISENPAGLYNALGL